MNAPNIFASYSLFADQEINDRFIKPELIQKKIAMLPTGFSARTLGFSHEGRPITMISCGQGAIRIMAWSQMHGDESTGTMAIMDLLGFLNTSIDVGLRNLLMQNCTIYLIPMVNPDGATRFTRRNAQELDINRDYSNTISLEAKILRDIRREIQPDFGFNLHDQNLLWSVGETGNPATLSFLAPASDQSCTVSGARKSAMLVTADMFETMNPLLPNHIGLFDESFEPRAFGDNFQMEGTATILIEAGGKIGDPEKQEIRKYFFIALLAGLESIATNKFRKQQLTRYKAIPPNTKMLFHILIHQLSIYGIQTSVGIDFIESPSTCGSKTIRTYFISDVGDLSNWSAYDIYSATGKTFAGLIKFGELANFDLIQDGDFILSFKDGILQSKQ